MIVLKVWIWGPMIIWSNLLVWKNFQPAYVRNYDNIKLKSILEGARFSVNSDIIDNGNVDAAVRQRGLKVADYLYKLESQLK